MTPLPLREEIERSGNWLFRYRSYVPLVIVPAVVPALRNFDYPLHDHSLEELWEALCLLVALAGLGIRVLVVGYAPRRTSGRNTGRGQIAEVLNTTGAYSLVRHPLYLGNYIMGLGLLMIARSGWMLLFYSFAYWIYKGSIMFAEEEFLRRRFGTEFLRWAEETPAFIPRLHGWKSPLLPFSLRNVLKREYTGLMAVSGIFAAMDLLVSLAAEGRPNLDEDAVAVLAVGLVVYLVLRSLKRRTRLLHVDGR